MFFFRALSESERKSNQTITSNIIFKENPDINLCIFAGLVLVTVFSNIFRAMYFFATLVRCSRQLHNTMFQSMLKAPMYFFDTNPVGELNACLKAFFTENKTLLTILFWAILVLYLSKQLLHTKTSLLVLISYLFGVVENDLSLMLKNISMTLSGLFLAHPNKYLRVVVLGKFFVQTCDISSL